MEDKLNYCQQCHLHKSECRCELTYKITKLNINEIEKIAIPIMLSNWTLNIKGHIKIVENIVVKDIGLDNIKKDSTFLNRVRRETKVEDFEVINIEFTKNLGETFN